MKAKNIFNIELLVNGIGDLAHTLSHDTPNTARKTVLPTFKFSKNHHEYVWTQEGS